MTDFLLPEYVTAQARFHRGMAALHEQLARDLAVLSADDTIEELPQVTGPVQRRIVRIPELFTEHGLTATAVARKIEYDEANVYTVLKSLQGNDLLEQVEGVSPRRWRFLQKHRTSRVLRLSRLIPAGAWTTYGDFAIAVYDNTRMARAVGQAARKNPAFSNPHRVLKKDGYISEEWRDDEGRGPEECQRRLEEEGVKFAQGGQAGADSFIGWENLKELLDADEAGDLTQ